MAAAGHRPALPEEVEPMYEPDRVRSLKRPRGLPFHIGKLGHVVLNVRDVERSARFYTEVLGFEISDVYPEEMVRGGMVFLRCNPDHHGIALVGSMKAEAANIELNHIAFEVATVDEVIRARDHLRRHGVKIDFAGRRRAGATSSRALQMVGVSNSFKASRAEASGSCGIAVSSGLVVGAQALLGSSACGNPLPQKASPGRPPRG